MLLFEELKLVSDMELAAVLVRGYILDEIEKDALWSEHPEGFGSLKEAAQAFGTSVSMLSDTKSLYDIIFPAISALGLSVPELWEDIGKSNFRAIIPILRAIITDSKSKGKEVNEVIDKVYEEVDSLGPYESETDRKTAAINHVLDAAKHSDSDMSKILAKYAINSLLLSRGGSFYLLTKMTEEEKNILMKRFGRMLDVRYVDGDGYRLEDIVEVRNLMEGGSNENNGSHGT